MIEFKNVKKTYKSKKGLSTKALKGINLKLGGRGLVFILGKSGSGKSTFLNILGGLDGYDSGDVIVNGKSLKSFKQKDFDAYRNTYIGFIFQDFNLLDNYTVEQNIKLALELQEKKVGREEILEILKQVRLEDILKRKPNELSGGQKQRVSIARALIKNPEIILADEPTGNVDSVTSRQIFDILKSLSHDKLIVVVSHDEEAALKYGDRVIRISDGLIVEDTGKKFLDNGENFSLVNAKLPLFYSFKMGIGNLFHKKLRLFFTVLLTTFSIICLGLMVSATSFDLDSEHIDTLVKNNEYEVSVNKYNKVIDYDEQISTFFGGGISSLLEEEEESSILNIDDYMVKEANEKTGLKWYKEIKIVQDSQAISFEFLTNNADQGLYYSENLSLSFVEIDDSDNIANLIGNMPVNNNEIVISKYIADNIIKNGVYLEKVKNKEDVVYKPNSYNQIINDGKLLQLFGISKGVKIVGIIDDDLSEYEILKSVSWDDYLNSLDYDNIYMDLQSDILKFSRVYITKDFISALNLKENNMSIKTSKIYANDKYYLVSQIGYIDDEIEVFDGNDLVKLKSLEDNEVVIDINVLNDITDGKYQKELDKYINDNMFMESYSVDNFTKTFIKNNNIIGSKIKSNVVDGKITYSLDKYHEYVIKGVIIKDSYMPTIYYSLIKLDGIVVDKIYSNSMFTVAGSREDLEKIFNVYPINKSDTLSTTTYSEQMIGSLAFVYLIKLVGKYGSIFFLVFAMILLVNFINNSISYRKKEIGILRALGCKSKDVVSMFIIESMVLVLICLLLSHIGISKIVVLFNDFMGEFIGNDISFLVYGGEQFLMLVGITVLIILVANLIPIRKITRMKPIDNILNK